MFSAHVASDRKRPNMIAGAIHSTHTPGRAHEVWKKYGASKSTPLVDATVSDTLLLAREQLRRAREHQARMTTKQLDTENVSVPEATGELHSRKDHACM